MANPIGGATAGAIQTGQVTEGVAGTVPLQPRAGRLADGRSVVWQKGAVSPGSLRNVTSVPQVISKPLSGRSITRGEDQGLGDAGLRSTRSVRPAGE